VDACLAPHTVPTHKAGIRKGAERLPKQALIMLQVDTRYAQMVGTVQFERQRAIGDAIAYVAVFFCRQALRFVRAFGSRPLSVREPHVGDPAVLIAAFDPGR
jgi:hypothetical protein